MFMELFDVNQHNYLKNCVDSWKHQQTDRDPSTRTRTRTRTMRKIQEAKKARKQRPGTTKEKPKRKTKGKKQMISDGRFALFVQLHVLQGQETWRWRSWRAEGAGVWTRSLRRGFVWLGNGIHRAGSLDVFPSLLIGFYMFLCLILSLFFL